MVHDLDIETWEKIASALGVSARTAQTWSQREVDPLPAKRVLGRIRASSEALRAWHERQVRAA
jgi:DNA-binding transcriptional regulator YiaG